MEKETIDLAFVCVCVCGPSVRNRGLKIVGVLSYSFEDIKRVICRTFDY